ncbi:mediator of DNA damage checkpoint protein 1 [Mixophyes fleayi]|uniref:mediator of DNA damage checkpoint protein 1 n=1 Tax=Mixophyes fleayi TaxID=3061075 RepID=UPI003F4E3346
MDDTQRLQWDDDEEETPVNRHRPVGNLHMFAGIHGPAQDFPIYLGQNLIGRHASCDITLPAQSVSKKHAILEVKADCHTICDNSSLNKTRRGKAALSPNVRYSLSDGDFLMFADVACRYTIAKKVEETTTLEDSEDDSVLVPGTQGPLAIENTPAVAIRRMVRGTVLARDSGDEDEDSDVPRKFSGEGEGFGSVKDSHKTSGPGAVFSPITDTIVPESDEENDTSTSESHFPSLNLRCDSDKDTHETSTRRSSSIPSSLGILTPPSLNEQAKDVPPVDKEEKKADIRTDGENKFTLLTKDASDIKDDQEGEQKAKSMLDDSLSGDDGGHVQAVVVSVTLDANLKEATNEREETLKDDTMNKQTPKMMSTGNPCVQEDEDADSRKDIVQKDELNTGNNAPIEENNIKLMGTDLKEVEADFYLDTDTDVDEEDTTSSPSGVKKTETVEIKTDGGQEQINGRTLGMSGAVLDIKEDDAASSGADLETVKTHQINIDSDTDDEADNATHADQKKSDRTEVNLGSNTDGEDDPKMVKSTSENADVNRRKEEHSRTSMTTETSRPDSDSDTDVENTADIAKPDEKKTMQDSRSTSEEKNEGFHMDSDTDVEDDVSNPEVKKDEWTTSITVRETKNKLHPDSDTDVDEDVDISSTVLTKDKQDSGTMRMDAQETKDDFHLDSDTDVDEEDAIPGASDAVMENRPTSQIHIDDQQKVETAKSDGEKDETGVTNKEASALHVDEDKDVDEDDALCVLVLDETLAAEETTKSGREVEVTKEEAAAFQMDSDTGVDENDGPGPGLEEAEVAEGNMQSGGIREGGGAEVLETGKALVPSGGETGALTQALKVETTNIPAKNSLEEEETQKTDSESTDYDLMATQCYLEPQEEESNLPDEEEATQDYIFSSTWAEPDPFKRPADPISVLQISAVTLNASDEEIDDNAIAETQPYCSEEESHVGLRVQETPELGNDSVYEQETTQPADSVEGSETKLQQISCGTISQEDTQPVSQYLATRAPQETGSWLHLKRDVPASVWVRSILQEEASTDQKEEADATKEVEQVSSMELEATQPYTLGIPASHTLTVQVHTPDVPAAEEDGISALPATENRPSTPCSLEAPTTDDLTTQAHSVADDTQPCSPHVQTTGEDDTPDLNAVATGCDDTKPCSSVSVLTGEEDAKETSNKVKGKLSTRRGLSRSIKREESAKKVQTAAEIVEHPEEVLAVSEPLPEKLNERDAGVPKQPGNEMKGGRRRGAGKMGVVEVEDKIETKEEGVSTDTRLRTNKRSSESEPSTSGINEKVKRKKLTGKSLVNVIKEELEDECKEDSGLTTEERKDITVPTRNLPLNPAGMIESQICEDDKGDNVVKHMSEKSKDQPKENDSKTSAEISETPIVSDGNSTQTVSESNVDLPNKKRVTTKRRAAAKLKKYTTEEAESRDNGDKMNDELIDDHNSRVFQEQEVIHGKSLEKRTTRKSDVVTAELVEQKNDKGEDNRSSIKTRRAATKEEIPQVSTPVAVRKRGQASKAEVKVKRKKSDESIEQEKVGEGKTGEDNTSSITGQTEDIQVGLADPSSGNEKSRRLRRNVKEEIKEESEKVEQAGKLTSRRSMSTRGGEKKMEEKESQGNSEDSPVSKTMPRRTRRFSKEETAKTEEVTDVGKTEADDTARKSSRTRKNVKEVQKTEVDIGNKEDAKMSETQTTRRAKRECRNEESVEKRGTAKETVSRRTKKNSKEEEVAQLEEDQSKISGRTRKGSKEELKTEQKGEETIAETPKEEPIGKKTTPRTRKNVKDDKRTGSEQADVDSKSERSSSRTRRKISMEDTEEVHGESKTKEVLGEGAEERPEVELSAHEQKSRLSAGRSRRAATKEEIPLVSTPVAVRKRGQAAKAEVEVKRKKSDESIEQEEVVEAETPPSRRGRPRRLVAEAGSTETGNADGKEIHPPSPSPSRSSRQRPSSALSNPPEIRTPRRTNRTSTSAAATSPYVPHAGSAPKVLFTGVVDALGEGIIRTLGGDIADSVFDCTHLVTDRVRRTVKFLCALARGIPIVTLDWIDKCKKSGCFLSPTGFLVNDKEQEKSFNFVLSESLQKAKRRPLFEGYEIHITANVKPEPENMKDIIRCSGATFLPKMPRTFKEKSVVVSCPEDAARCKSVPSSVPVTTAEFILSGILRQEVNPTAYLLNPAVEKTPAKRRR